MPRDASELARRLARDAEAVWLQTPDWSASTARSSGAPTWSQSSAAIVRLIGALLLEQNDEWAVQRRYMTLETLEGLSDDPQAKAVAHCSGLSHSPNQRRAQAMTGALTPPLGTRSLRRELPQDAEMTASGRVSRAPSRVSAVRNCTRDEGGPFGFGDQVVDPKPPRAAAVKSRGGERCGNAGARPWQVWSREASASEPLQKRRKRIRRCQNRGVTLPLGSARGMP
jgi:hypothetical protein